MGTVLVAGGDKGTDPDPRRDKFGFKLEWKLWTLGVDIPAGGTLVTGVECTAVLPVYSVLLSFTYVRRTFLFLHHRAIMAKFFRFVRGTICFIKLYFFVNIMVVVFFAANHTSSMVCFRFKFIFPYLFLR